MTWSGSYNGIVVALTIMEKCFVPMVDTRTYPYDTAISKYVRLNYWGFYTMVLEKDDTLLCVVDIPEQILKVKQEVETEFFGETQSRTESEGTAPAQPQARFTELDTRDWRGRASSLVEEDVGRDNQNFNRLENEQEPNSQYGRGPIANQGVSSSTRRPALALVKAEVPWSIRRGTLSYKDHAFKIVKRVNF
ncbi:hypothetical protein Tco_0196020 [Tanacetum coccineum]